MTETQEATTTIETKKAVEIQKTESHEVGHVHGPNCNHGHHHHHAPMAPFVRPSPKVGRNDPCPCQSGLKYKKCCASAG